MQTDARIDLCKVIAIVGVVVLHVSTRVLNASDFGGLNWWMANIADSAVRWCVPVFVMVSGATLISRKSASMSLHDYYTRRMHRILIPLVVWSIVYILWKAARFEVTGQDPLGVEGAVKSLLRGKPYYHMWFLYMLLGLYLFAPFLSRLIVGLTERETRWFALAALALAALAPLYELAMGEEVRKIFLYWFLLYIGYFVAGRVIYTSAPETGRGALVSVLLVSVILTASGTYVLASMRGGELSEYFYDNLSVTVIPMSLVVFAMVVKLRHVPRPASSLAGLASASFGVYLVHPIFLDVLDPVLASYTRDYALVHIPVLSGLVLLFSVLFSIVVLRIPYLKSIC